MNQKTLISVLSVLCIAFLLFRLGQFLYQPKTQDFNVYYFGGKAYAEGISPYSSNRLDAVSDGIVYFPFVYPPYTLPIVQHLHSFDRQWAARVYVLIKTAALFFLLWIWLQWIPKSNRSEWFPVQLLIILSVGFYESLFRDFRHGNISTFEQMFLWFGILNFVRGKYWIFSASVFAASFFKLALIPFLGLLLFVSPKKSKQNILAFIIGCLAFLSLQTFGYLNWPHLFADFLSTATGLEETGPLNPSMMMFVKAIFYPMGIEFYKAIYAVIAAGILGFFLWRFLPYKKSETDRLLLSVGFTLLYILIMPRIKDYSFIMLFFPALWLLQKNWHFEEKKEKWMKAAFMFFAVVHIFAYQSWLCALFLFFMWLRIVRFGLNDVNGVQLRGDPLAQGAK